MGTAPSQSFTYIVAQVQSEFDPAFVRSRVDAFFDEHFAWLEDQDDQDHHDDPSDQDDHDDQDGVKEEEFQTCLRGEMPAEVLEERLRESPLSQVLSELKMKPKNLSEEPSPEGAFL
ncbi:hypothetical protein AK812_SmicGene41197 [Symbiodinium microadriaticum]|uniref:Uncharacterized protein n=1 Tax=Symbiodinium microadriaticum TaxID=2951 RepID=A0A1Q9C6V6_SYMMI|nr:hypothetical protein AK812_SmicGene41197 [Symbiodinium microadriaticum]